MANPNKGTIRAACELQEHHKEDDVVFYAVEGGEAAIVIINDPALLEVVMVLMNYMEAKEDGDVSLDGPVVITPRAEIEA
jgi:hypothetical protein